MTKDKPKTNKVDVALIKEQQKLLDKEQHKELKSNLSAEQSKKLEESDKIITRVETNLIDNENSNLDIIKNLSVDLKDILPLNKMYEGIDIKELDKFKFNKEGKPTDYISFELFNDISKFILMNVEQAEADVPLLKKLKAINDFVEAGNNFLPDVQQAETISELKDCLYNLLDVSVNSNKFEILTDTLINLTDEATFKEFKKYIKSFESKSVKIKTYQAVKFDGSKVKYLQADTSENLVKQLKAV